jgi:ATP-binding cassette subfamily F protein 3
LVLIDGGTAKDYAGSIEDYIDFVLGRNQSKEGGAKSAKAGAKPSGKARAQERFIRSEIVAAEKAIAKLQAQCQAIDRAMYEPADSAPELANKTMTELLAERAKASGELEVLEDEWLALSERLGGVG